MLSAEANQAAMKVYSLPSLYSCLHNHLIRFVELCFMGNRTTSCNKRTKDSIGKILHSIHPDSARTDQQESVQQNHSMNANSSRPQCRALNKTDSTKLPITRKVRSPGLEPKWGQVQRLKEKKMGIIRFRRSVVLLLLCRRCL